MRILPTVIGVLLLAILSGGVWVMRYRPQWLEPATVDAAADEDLDPQKLEIPVHTGKISRATLHRYVEAIGFVEPAPARPGRMAGTADVAAPVAGIIAEILCEAGQSVKQGTPLIQLDDRVAKATEEQAAATLAEAKATLAQLKATPRPEQLAIAQLAVDKAKIAVEFAQKGFTRQTDLAKSQGTSQKSVEQAALEMASAQNDQAVAEKQLVLLKSSPTPEELAAQTAKVAQAEAALAAARTQRELLRIVSPIDATIVAITGNPGEAVDATKVLVDLVALDRLVVNVAVPAEDLPSLKVGMTVQVSPATASATESPSEGKVYFVGSEVDRKTNTVPVSVELGGGMNVRPGQSVRVKIVAEEHKDCLAVPKASVVADVNGDNFIALVQGDQASHKIVKAGLREGDLVEINADGLTEGDTVVTGGAYGLAQLQVAKVKVLEN